MAKRDLYLEHLAKVPLFADCSRQELTMIARRGTDVTFSPGQTVVREGTPGYEFFVIVDGAAVVTRDGDEIAQLGPGDFFGEFALLHEAPRNATVAATGQLETIVVQSQEFGSLLREAPELARKVMAGMARRLQHLDTSRLV